MHADLVIVSSYHELDKENILPDGTYTVGINTSDIYLEIVKYLVQCDADIMANDNIAIKSATRNGNFEIVKYLATYLG